MNYKRILVLGAPGCGKSLFSLEIGKKLNLPVIHLDQEYWKPNWAPLDLMEFRKNCLLLANSEEWVMDGNFGTTFKERWARADAVIYIDRSPWACLLGQMIRFLGIGKRIGRAKGCKERFNSQLFWLTYKFRGAHGVLIEKKCGKISLI